VRCDPRGLASLRPVAQRVTEDDHKPVLADAALVGLAVRFLVCFAALFAVITWLSVRTPLVGDLQAVTAVAAASLMNLSGVMAVRTGTLIAIPGRQLAIGADCTGLTIAAMLAALIVAYPVRPSSRVLGVAAGVIAVLVANQIRLVAIAHLAWTPDWFFYGAHDFFFQIGMVAVAIVLWASWLLFARARES
jgi:exosortase/archaeosortase family protein